MIRGDGSVEFPHPEGSLLGVMSGQTYGTARFRLNRGDRLIIYTDGLEEAFRERDAKCSCQRELRDRAALPLERLFDDLTDKLDELCLLCGPCADDITILGMERGLAATAHPGID